MRLIKMFGLSALAAVAAMAAVGATSASATSTKLCSAHTGLTCSSAAPVVHGTLAAGTVFKVLTSVATILCLNALEETANASVLVSNGPQPVFAAALELTNCGTNASHTNCEAEIVELPGYNLLKTGLDTGSLTGTLGQLRIICENILGFIDIDCKYNTTGMLFVAGSSHITAYETSITEVGDKSLCPNTSKLDFLLKGLSTTYVLG